MKSDPVPTNAEMYNRICGGKSLHKGDKDALEFWNNLENFSSKNNLLECNFEGRIKENFHACFWEIYLPKAFDDNGISLRREGESLPDFCFEKNGKKIWLEAVACGEPEERNKVPAPVLDGEFENGIAPEAQIMQRLASSVEDKITKFNEKYSKTIKGSNDFYVIALNGYRAINNYLHDKVFPPPFVVKTLFGMGDYRLFYEQGKRVDEGFGFIRETDKHAPIAHFTKSANQKIAGVLYSKASVWSCNLPCGQDFLFVQNPYAPDITDIFDFCKEGRWIRRDLQQGRWRIENIDNLKTEDFAKTDDEQ